MIYHSASASTQQKRACVIYLCTYVYTNIYTYTYICICICICLYILYIHTVYTYCVYVYLYVKHIDTNIIMCIHVCIYVHELYIYHAMDNWSLKASLPPRDQTAGLLLAQLLASK